MKQLTIYILIFISTTAYAQQDPVFTQYLFVPNSINPAYAGRTEFININLLSRHQWLTFEGAPNTQTLAADVPINESKAGIGAVIINDRIGPVNQTTFYTDYSYQIQILKNKYLAFGLRTGMSLYSIKLSELEATEADDEAISQDVTSRFIGNAGFGVHFYDDKFFASFSTPRILKNKIDNIATETDEISRFERLFVLMGGYNYEIQRNLELHPALVAKFVPGSPISFDINTTIYYNKSLTTGFLYRIGDALGLILQFEFLDHFKVGYSVDYSLSSIGRNSSGTHEFLLGYKFAPKKKIYLNFLER